MCSFSRNIFHFLITIFLSFYTYSQKDTLPYETYNKNVVWYSDFGFNTAPFSLSYKFNDGIDKLKFRNNYKNLIGLGVSYKWLSLRLSFAIGENAKPVDKFGKTNYGSLGFSFTHKNYFWDAEYRNVSGYVIKNAFKWNDSLSNSRPNYIRSNTKSYGLSVNAWYFKNDNFKMEAVMGKTGHFLKEVRTLYIKSSFNVYGVNNGNNSLIPKEMIDTNNSKTLSSNFSAVDIGVIPGYAYANRKNNWQISGLLGLGGVIQNKYYNINGASRGFIGLAPRYDVRLVAGYSSPSYFIFFVTDFDNKSIRFNNLVFRQSFYSLKLVGGIRLNKKVKKSES